jgi:TRAP-type C4-dicarboxylate transport system permease small subunit
MDIWWIILELPFLGFKWALIFGFWYMILYFIFSGFKNIKNL